MRASTAAPPHTKDSGHWGKPAAGVAAVKVALYHLLDDRPEKTVLSLKPGLILGQELVKVMEEQECWKTEGRRSEDLCSSA